MTSLCALLAALAWAPARAQGVSRSEKAPPILVMKTSEARWTLNGGAIYGPSRLEDRLALLDRALGILERSPGFIGAGRLDRRDRIGALRLYLFESARLEQEHRSAQISLDYEGRVWKVVGDHEEFGQFEEAWLGGGFAGSHALTVYGRSLPDGAFAPGLQYLDDSRRVALSEPAYRRESGALGGVELHLDATSALEERRDSGWARSSATRFSRLVHSDPVTVGELAAAVSGAVILKVRSKRLPCAGVDPADLFDERSRSQANIGSCHAFASTSIVEAALRREYGRSPALSRLDLFAGVRLGRPSEIVASHREVEGQCRMSYHEGWSPALDLRHALEHGIATERSLPYGKAAGYLMAKPFQGEPCEKDPSGRCRRPDELREEAGRLAEATKDAGLDAERETIREALRGFEVVETDFFVDNALDASGVSQRDRLAGYLCRGVPVAASMELAGLGEWGVGSDEPHAQHAFVVSGFRKTVDGAVFTTLNSWGPWIGGLPSPNPDIPPSHLSRVYRVTALLGPKDRGAPSEPDPELLRKLDALGAR